jgi:hypothetical protein
MSLAQRLAWLDDVSTLALLGVDLESLTPSAPALGDGVRISRAQLALGLRRGDDDLPQQVRPGVTGRVRVGKHRLLGFDLQSWKQPR